MIVIVGLGNPGKDYQYTRHNAGFLCLDALQTAWQFPQFHSDKHFQAEIAKGKMHDQDILLVKPQTFMNLSGQSVLAVQQFYKLPVNHFWLVYDELDLPIGKVRIRKDGSSAGHNGIKSIIAALGSDQFYRFRIGVKPEHYQPGMERQSTVLERFSVQEEEHLFNVFGEVQKAIEKELITIPQI
ncbi:MAG: aminoacyl-tRNA hydrolase [Candidatus Abawacabacteria bacterium]|nr:aminoacyl-tRNA hydrolase [Candidatus Abawacabacteria bacterium]